jgi:AcrR family transcriptional regulator
MAKAKPRERLLDTATALFNEKGVLAVGVNTVILEADVAPMTLYRQFGGKDELVAATLELWSTRWLDSLSERLERYGDDPRARYAGLWDALAEWFAEDDFRGSYIANAASELRSTPDHRGHKVVARHRQTLRDFLAELADSAGAEDPGKLAAQLMVLMDGAIALATVDAGSRENAARDARMLALAALQANADAA